MSHNSSPENVDDLDDSSYLSYFSSFNRQSFETKDGTDASQATHAEPLPPELTVSGPPGTDDRVPHPPMRSTITPINITLPPPDVHAAQIAAMKRTRGRRGGGGGGGSAGAANKNSTPPKAPGTPTPNPYVLSSGPIASLINQHNHTMASHLQRAAQSSDPNSQPIPTVVLQPVLMALTHEQQVAAAQLQEQFFQLVSNIGQNGQGPLAVVAPNLNSLAARAEATPDSSAAAAAAPATTVSPPNTHPRSTPHSSQSSPPGLHGGMLPQRHNESPVGPSGYPTPGANGQSLPSVGFAPFGHSAQGDGQRPAAAVQAPQGVPHAQLNFFQQPTPGTNNASPATIGTSASFGACGHMQLVGQPAYLGAPNSHPGRLGSPGSENSTPAHVPPQQQSSLFFGS